MITDHDARDLVEVYLRAEETAELDLLTPRFAAVQTVRNAAQPPVTGADALEQFCVSFWDRTERREFELVDVAVDGQSVMAFAWATLAFRAGAAFGPVVAKAPFTVRLPIGLRFHLDTSGAVDELDVFHETTTAAKLAAAS